MEQLVEITIKFENLRKEKENEIPTRDNDSIEFKFNHQHRPRNLTSTPLVNGSIIKTPFKDITNNRNNFKP